jgi:DNA repair protein RadC
MTITQLSPADRPREKLERSGPAALGDNELLAIILGQGVRRCNALELANEVLAEVGGVRGLARASRDQLRRRRGVGSSRAGRILAAVELGRRTLRSMPDDRPLIKNARDVFALLAPEFGARAVEHFGILLLDVRHRVLRTQVLSTGATDGTYVDPGLVFREALVARAKAIIAFHNHPSGDPLPSVDDLALTERLQVAGDVMGIAVLDHVIVTNDRYYSLKESAMAGAEKSVADWRRAAE